MAKPHAYQLSLGGEFVFRNRRGQIAPVVGQIASEYHRLRALCAQHGWPNTFYDSPEWFTRHLIADHHAAIDRWSDPTLLLSLKEPERGLVRGNIQVSHEPAGGE